MNSRSPLGQEELVASLRLAATAYHEQGRDATGHLLTDAADKIEALRAALVKFVDHFGPLENNFMVHEDARACFRLAREALGPKDHDAILSAALQAEGGST